MDPVDRELWTSLVGAQQAVAKLRAAFHERETRLDVLQAALATDASSWDQLSAMNYLKVFRNDIAQFVEPLFGYALGGRWEGTARDILALGSSEDVVTKVCHLVSLHFPRPDPEDYYQVAALLAALNAGATLGEIATEALGSKSSEVREAGEFIENHYRHAIEAGRAGKNSD